MITMTQIGAAYSEVDRLREENERLRVGLWHAVDCLKDMLMGDDGQAWKEAERALPGIEEILAGTSALAEEQGR